MPFQKSQSPVSSAALPRPDGWSPDTTPPGCSGVWRRSDGPCRRIVHRWPAPVSSAARPCHNPRWYNKSRRRRPINAVLAEDLFATRAIDGTLRAFPRFHEYDVVCRQKVNPPPRPIPATEGSFPPRSVPPAPPKTGRSPIERNRNPAPHGQWRSNDDRITIRPWPRGKAVQNHSGQY